MLTIEKISETARSWGSLEALILDDLNQQPMYFASCEVYPKMGPAESNFLQETS
jgi:hypothetical protein